jgi:hypothetical protein
MKRIFTLSTIVLAVSLIFSGCIKDTYYNGGFNEGYWLAKERGEVVYSDNYCNYYVVETFNGYTIIRTYGNYKPYEGSVVYGNFSYAGTRDIYNRTSGVVFTGTVTDYWLTYNEAQNALDYYCPLYGKNTTREFKKSSISK